MPEVVGTDGVPGHRMAMFTRRITSVDTSCGIAGERSTFVPGGATLVVLRRLRFARMDSLRNRFRVDRMQPHGELSMAVALKATLLGILPPTIRGRLRAWRSRQLIQNYPKRVVEHTFGKVRLKVCLTDPLAEEWYDHDWPDLPEVAVLRQHRLAPGARVFDLGAHHGVVAMMLGHEVGPTGQVIALEGLPHNAEAAETNVKLNAATQVQIVSSAISDRSGTLTFTQRFNGSLANGSPDQGEVVVPATTIDDLADRYGMPDVVFLDVEGAECLALSSAARVLASPADFFVEVHVNIGLERLGGSVAKVLSYFPKDQYELLVRSEEQTEFRPILENDPLFSDRFFLLAFRSAQHPGS